MTERGAEEATSRTKTEERVSQLAEVLNLSGDEGDFKVRMALFNQRLAMDFYRILSNGGENQASAAQNLIDALRNTVRNDLKKFSEANNIIASARAQAGVMDCLKRSGYSVIMPKSLKAVESIDARSGVDLAAISKTEGRAYFIDVSARNREGSGQINKTVTIRFERKSGGAAAAILTTISEGLQKTGQKLASYDLAGRKKFPYAFVRITIPTGREFMDITGKLSGETSKNLVGLLQEVPIETWV